MEKTQDDGSHTDTNHSFCLSFRTTVQVPEYLERARSLNGYLLEKATSLDGVRVWKRPAF